MASELTSIYDAIAGLSITVGDKTLGASNTYDLDELKDWVESADLPLRLLSVSGTAAAADQHSGSFIGAGGNLARVTWTISDLMLWAVGGSGRGLIDHVEALHTYMVQYLEALRGLRGPTTQSHIVGYRFDRGVYNYPPGSDRNYYGVLVTVDVEEFISS